MDSTVRLFQQKNVKASNVQQCGTRNMLKIVYVIIFQVSPTSGLSRFDLRMLPNHIKKEPRRESFQDSPERVPLGLDAVRLLEEAHNSD